MPRKTREYSRDFPKGRNHKRYLLDKIPAALWTAVKAKARRDGVSLRATMLRFLSDWSQS